MKNDPNSYCAVAGLYRTAVAVSALILSSSFAFAADPPVPRSNVSANVNPTTGYYSTSNTTLRLPNGVSVTPSAGASAVTKYSGGLQQTMPTGITIDAIKKSAPLPVVVRAKTQSVKNAAKSFFGSPKANLGFLALSIGLQELMDGVDWVMGEGGKIQRVSTDSSTPTDGGGMWCINGRDCSGSPAGAAAQLNARLCPDQWQCPYTYSHQVSGILARGTNGTGGFFNIDRDTGISCEPPYSFDSNYHCVKTESRPVPDSEIASTVDSQYNPDPSDWRALSPHLDLDDVEITWAPTLQGEPKTTTEYDAEGNPHRIRETNIWYDFDIRDNPSPQPKVDLKTREETKTFEDGVLTGTTTTESTDSAGSDDTPPPPPESPIDCDLFPTACAWFDWTKEEPVEPDDDLSPLLQEVPIVSETYTITGGVAACPAPLVLDLSVFGSREVSYQPLCDLASTMKFLYLALMSFAAAVLLHRSINRV